MTKRRPAAAVPRSPYLRETEYALGPRTTLRAGDPVAVVGCRRRFAFVARVTNPRTGATWLDVRDLRSGELRAFYPDRVRYAGRRRRRAS